MKTQIEGKWETVVETHEHLYLLSNYTIICVMPYIIENGILSKVGVINDYNYIRGKSYPTLITGYKNSDDISDINTANRILFEHTNINMSDAVNYMYLGDLYVNRLSDTSIKLYCVDVTNKIKDFSTEKSPFYFMQTDDSIKSDDMLLLSSYLRLFNLFYAQSIGKQSD